MKAVPLEIHYYLRSNVCLVDRDSSKLSVHCSSVRICSRCFPTASITTRSHQIKTSVLTLWIEAWYVRRICEIRVGEARVQPSNAGNISGIVAGGV